MTLRKGAFGFGVVCVVLLYSSCGRTGLPEPNSKTYADFCSAFFLGLAGLQSGEDVRAKDYLTRSTQIVPGEPAAWADLGILQVRQQQFDAAFNTVDKARSLAPDNSRLEALLGLIESRRGKVPEALSHLKRAVALDSHNLKASYALAEETERDQTAGNDGGALQLLQQMLQQRPQNAALLLDEIRLAAKRGNVSDARQALAALQPLTESWPAVAKQQLSALEQSVNGPNIRAAAVQVQFLRNVLLREPGYRENLDEIKTPSTLVAQPFVTFLRLPTPTSQPAPPDLQTRFDPQPLKELAGKSVSWIGAVALDEQGSPTIVWADESAIHIAGAPLTLPLPQGNNTQPLNKNAIAAADLNYDFKTDLAVATQSGLKIYQQQDPAHFLDVTANTKIPASIVNGSYTGVWAFDVDLDGDLDLILGVAHGEPVVLRNNGDGTYTPIAPFRGVDGLTAFAAADIDGDGDPDVALIDGNGRLAVFSNERLGQYRRRDVPESLGERILAMSAADINGDGSLDFVLIKPDFTVWRLSSKDDGAGWDLAELVQAAPFAGGSVSLNLFLADLDNNGALDIVAGDQVFLNDGKTFTALTARLPGAAQAISGIGSDGRLNFVALNQERVPVELINRGVKNYHWQIVRTKAAHATGDQRINSFGIGGEIEIRSDLLAQKQIISSPILHFGLGDHIAVQFARIVWPNGSVQAEFDLKPDQTLLAEQRIKGSCPMLFTWDGHAMRFLKDVGPWGSALGLNVNAQGKGIYGTREWFNVRGDELVPHDGYYDLRITAEYWETYYMDHYSLLAVDHPANSEVFTDERFALPSPAPSLIATTETRPFICATDDNGHDVTDIVRNLDDKFLDNFGRGQYQGLTRDHWVELELPADAPRTGSLYLIGQSWIHDTDATIVKAQAQNSKAHPQGLSIEVPDVAGRWTTVRNGLGFPKGRVKTIVLDISGIFRPGAARKLRLRTNLELYWNKVAWAAGLPADNHIKTQHLDLAAADLRYRGFSLITKANPSSPELPHYDVVQESALKWRDQEGYATRYGDVRELLEKVDDRYVITSPGDELRMRFTALPPPSTGWKRDFILICDGWVKDGDYNSTFAGTILPLPYHGMKDYILPPTTLEADRAYQLHPADWSSYQTRYVSAHDFVSALWSR